MNCPFDKNKLKYSRKDQIGNNIYYCSKCNRNFALIEVIKNSSEIFVEAKPTK